MRSRPAIALAAVVLSACGSSSSVSTPVISELTLAGSTTPGGTEDGSFFVSNSSGVEGLSLHFTLTDPAGYTTPSEVVPLAVTGADQLMANAMVAVVVPTNASAGTYSITISVSDGADTSNSLTATFQVD
jgi:hypothetical protein